MNLKWKGATPLVRVMRATEIPFDDDPDACWETIPNKRDREGYGRAHAEFEHRTEGRAHRVAWTVNFGPIPDGMQVLHRCDNPPCVRPSHLFLGTQLDNMHDRAQKQRHQYGERHHKAKLTESDVIDIRTLSAFGASGVDLARAFGVSGSVIGSIKNRRTWRHVP